MKHTPAPWKADAVCHSKSGNMDIYRNGETIAQVLPERTIEEQEANARLIAAAPELLEALQNLMAQAVKDAERYAPEGNEPIWSFISDASTAIHKTTQS